MLVCFGKTGVLNITTSMLVGFNIPSRRIWIRRIEVTPCFFTFSKIDSSLCPLRAAQRIIPFDELRVSCSVTLEGTVKNVVIFRKISLMSFTIIFYQQLPRSQRFDIFYFACYALYSFVDNEWQMWRCWVLSFCRYYYNDTKNVRFWRLWLKNELARRLWRWLT